ncbi:hypothetical protein N9A28_08425 [Sulfurimonas sp.]|nr:hypothetical protein [Sulfurimonas sp.]
MKKLLILIISLSNLLAFSTTNIQVLYGSFNDNSYVFDTRSGGKATITLEHYSSLEYGDVFMFLDAYRADDRFKYHDSKSDFYGEVSPRVDLGNILDVDLSFLFINKVYLAAQYNQGEAYKAYLYGIGTNLNIPGFKVFDLNIYKKNQSIGDNNYQLSINYVSEKLFDLFYLDAFIDWTEFDFLTEQKILVDVAQPYDGHNLAVGVEWHYYRQKSLPTNFNTKITSNAPQIMLKYSW